MDANPRSVRKVSAGALVGWSVFAIAIVWLALVYSDFGDFSGLEGVPEHTKSALKSVDFVVGLLFTSPYIVTAIVCFGSFHPDTWSASPRSQLVLQSARNGFRAAVILAILPCALVLFVFGVLGSSPSASLVYGLPEGAIVGIAINSILVLAAGLVGAFFGTVWGLVRRPSEGTQLEVSR